MKKEEIIIHHGFATTYIESDGSTWESGELHYCEHCGGPTYSDPPKMITPPTHEAPKPSVEPGKLRFDGYNMIVCDIED